MIPVAVVGCTGTQGSAVASYLAAQSDSFGHAIYSVTGFSRNPQSEAATALSSAAKNGNVRVVYADLHDQEGLKVALKGSKYAYLYTVPGGEVQTGKNFAEACKAVGVQFVVYNSAPDSKKVSGGKYTVPDYDDKHAIETYMSSIDLSHSAVRIGTFTANLLKYHWLRYEETLEGPRLILSLPVAKASTVLPWTDLDKDLGPVVHSILQKVEAGKTDVVQGQTFALGSELLHMDEAAAAIQRGTEIPTLFQEVSSDTVLQTMGAKEGNDMIELLSYYMEFLYQHLDCSEIPDPAVVKILGVKPGPVLEAYVRSIIVPWVKAQQKS